MYGPGSDGGRGRGGMGGGMGGGGGRGIRLSTPKGQMSGSNLLPAITGLPQHIKIMFEARPPIANARPMKKPKITPYKGIAEYVSLFETEEPPTREPYVTHIERKKREREALMKVHDEKVQLELEDYDPSKNPKATEDPYKTLMVARISYDTSEKKLRREFEQYGPIKSIRMITNEDGKPRGYAFIEYEREQDMRTAYKRADGKKIDGRRVLVDVERGRTVKGWQPRRLGGGLGGTRKGKDEEGYRPPSGRDDSSRGGDSRGGDSERRRSRSRDKSSRGDSRRDIPGHYGRGDGGSREGGRPDRDRGGGDRDNKRRRSRSRSGDRKRERT